MKLLLRAWHLTMAGLAAYVLTGHGREFLATFDRPAAVDVHPAQVQVADDDDVTALARATGVMPEPCPHLADDQDPELNARGGSRFCGLPAGHEGTEHPSLVEPAAVDR